MKKLLQNRGETLIESLVSILLVTFIMLFLSTAIVSAARINKRLRDTDISYKSDSSKTASEGTLTVTKRKINADGSYTDDTSDISSTIAVYRSDNGYVYYRYPDAANKGATP